MGDVLVYVESPVNDRLLAFARPLADAAGGDLVALLARGEPGAEEGRPRRTWCSRHRTRRSRRTSRKRTRRCSRRRSGSARPTSSCSRTPPPATTSPPRRGSRDGLPFVGYCVELALEDGEAQSISGIYGGQLQATARTPLPAVFAVNTAALHEEPQAAGRGERVQLAPPAELESLRTAFVEPVVPPDEGVDLTKAERIVCVGRGIGAPRTSRSRRSWPTRSAPSSGVAAGDRLGLAAQGPPGREVGRARDAEAVPRARRLGSRPSTSRGCRAPS